MDREITSYTTVRWLDGRYSEQLTKVRGLLDDGYQPFGGVAAAQHSSGTPIFIQAFVKYEEVKF